MPYQFLLLFAPYLLLVSSAEALQYARSLWNNQTMHLPPLLPQNNSPVHRIRVRNALMEQPSYSIALLMLLYPIIPIVLIRLPDWSSVGPYLAWIVVSALLAVLGRPGEPTCIKCDAPLLLVLFLPVILCSRDSLGVDFLQDSYYQVADGYPVFSLIRLSALNVGLVAFIVIRGFDRIGTIFDVTLKDFYRFLFALLVFGVYSLIIGSACRSIKFQDRVSVLDGIGIFSVIFLVIGLPQTVIFQGVLQELISRTFEMESSLVEFSDVEDILFDKSPRTSNRLAIDSSRLLLEVPGEIRESEIGIQSTNNIEFFKIRFLQWISLPSWQEWTADLITSVVFSLSVKPSSRILPFYLTFLVDVELRWRGILCDDVLSTIRIGNQQRLVVAHDSTNYHACTIAFSSGVSGIQPWSTQGQRISVDILIEFI